MIGSFAATRTLPRSRGQAPASRPERRSTLRGSLPIALAVAMAFLAVGCGPMRRHAEPAKSFEYVSVDDAALQLGLQLTSSSRHSARFQDRLNTVLLMGPPRAEVILNGHRYLADGVIVENNHLALPQGLVDEIRRELRTPSSAQIPPRPPQPTPEKPAVQTPGRPVAGVIVLDAGHGGSDPGAPNRYGSPEKVITLDITQRVRDLLVARGVRVIMTRDGDTYPELDDRVAIANRARPDVFVAIHANTAPRNSAARGFSVIMPRDSSAATMAAGSAVHRALSNVTVSRGLIKDPRGLRVLEKTNCPGMLIEVGFLTNAYEARRLGDPSYRQQLANAIAQGIGDYLERKR